MPKVPELVRHPETLKKEKKKGRKKEIKNMEKNDQKPMPILRASS